ncbi:AraC family transcriptional regulator [Mycolicibacterium flavescens]|uniref:AraC family transcriptional regulator n=1 Tax=Mycolicibacterium flavescens TaxID=1776 RepID=A0A1E3RQA6_MYCFV|nr:helix-turn-helix domain-containing protein [Mycolicibacterium flavescens]MCV7281548.1 AraC family transcriptional regulator [Mycolicibacterium flavescens]ODQ91592.1 AraC family transcriptional regulator [Mycolicibacterium flavescens]
MIPGSSVVFDSDDLGETEDFLSDVYTKMSIGGDAERAGVSITRRWLGDISFDELDFGFDLAFDAEALGRVTLCRVHRGHLEGTIGGHTDNVIKTGDVALASPPELPYSGRLSAARYDLTMFDPDLLNRVASPGPDSPGGRVRLLGTRPVSEEAARQLSAAIGFVREYVAPDTGEVAPLVASTAATLLASVVVSTLPTNAVLDPDAGDRVDARPVLLRRAIAFIESNAQADLALADIAAAVHVTARTLQYMFRRHLDMTPMEYLRRVRLDHAHRDLQLADPAETTVGMVAARWGFIHAGRFSGLYRQTYGRAPSVTLRG